MRIHSRPRFALAIGVALLSCSAPRAAPGSAESTANVEHSNRPDGLLSEEASVVTVESLRLTLSIVGASPGPGDPITLELVVLNEGSDDVPVDFPNGQRYDFEVFADDGTMVWHWADDMMFTMALGRETLASGEALRWQETLAAGLPAGSYRVVGTLASMERVSAELGLTIEG